MDSSPSIECSICGLDLNDKFSFTLKCNHAFHYECISKTFQTTFNTKINKKNSCPYCRTKCDYLPIVNGLNRIIPGIHCENNNQQILNCKNILQDKYSKPCQFILTRGKNKGKLCGKKCLLGYEYCSNHKNKVIN